MTYEQRLARLERHMANAYVIGRIPAICNANADAFRRLVDAIQEANAAIVRSTVRFATAAERLNAAMSTPVDRSGEDR